MEPTPEDDIQITEEELQKMREDIDEWYREYQEEICERYRKIPPKNEGIKLEITVTEEHELYAYRKIVEFKEIYSLKLDVAYDFRGQLGVVTDEELARVFALGNLQELYVHYMPVTGECLKYFGSLKKLQKLEFHCCPIDDSFFDHIPNTSLLRSLTFHICEEENFRSPRFDNLLVCENLRYLSLNNSTYHDDLIGRLPSHPEVRSLDLTANELTGRKLDFLKGMYSLEWLDLGRNKIDDEGVSHLVNSIPPSLETLIIGENSLMTDSALQVIAENQSIRMLTLDYNSNITDKGIQVLGKMQQLRNIHLGKTQVTLEGAKELQKSLRKCYINMGNIEGMGENVKLDPLEWPEDYD